MPVELLQQQLPSGPPSQLNAGPDLWGGWGQGVGPTRYPLPQLHPRPVGAGTGLLRGPRKSRGGSSARLGRGAGRVSVFFHGFKADAP